MEIWVLLIIAVKSKLGEAVENVEKKIMQIALNPYMQAKIQSSKISELINKKNMLVNLKVLYDRIEENIDAEKLVFLRRFLSARENVDEYCLKNRCDPTEFANNVLSFANEGSIPLKKLRLTVGKMEEDYSSIPLVYMTLLMIKRMLSTVKEVTPGVELAFRKYVSFIPSAL